MKKENAVINLITSREEFLLCKNFARLCLVENLKNFSTKQTNAESLAAVHTHTHTHTHE